MLGRTRSAGKLSFESLQPRRMLAAVTGVDPADQVEIGTADVGGGSTAPDVQAVSLTKYVDKSTTPLMLKCCKGEHLDDATLTVTKSGGDPLGYFAIEMKKVIVSSCLAGGGEDALAENVTLNFAEVRAYHQSLGDEAATAGRTIGM